METKQLTGIVGAIVLALGVFTPIKTLPFLGNVSLLGALDIAGILILVLATLSLTLSLINKCRFLWGTGISTVIILVVSLLTVLGRQQEGSESLPAGWVLLVTGAVIIISAAALEEISLRK